jgi:hypothetical protein
MEPMPAKFLLESKLLIYYFPQNCILYLTDKNFWKHITANPPQK